MRKIKVVQIGTGHDHAAPIMMTLKRLTDVFDLVGYAIPEGEQVTDPSPYPGVQQMTVEEALSFPGLDAAIIETAEPCLTKYASLAAARGLAVHMDKPGGLCLSDFEALIEQVKESGTLFHMGYMYRYNPAVMQ